MNLSRSSQTQPAPQTARISGQTAVASSVQKVPDRDSVCAKTLASSKPSSLSALPILRQTSRSSTLRSSRASGKSVMSTSTMPSYHLSESLSPEVFSSPSSLESSLSSSSSKTSQSRQCLPSPMHEDQVKDKLINFSTLPRNASHKPVSCSTSAFTLIPKETHTSEVGDSHSSSSVTHPTLWKSGSVASLFQIPRMLFVAALLMAVISLQPQTADGRSVGVCRGIPCANGGRLLVSNSIWGNCRCRCPSGFVGPYCQYRAAYKRNSGSANGAAASQTTDSGDRIHRSDTMELIRQHLLALSQMPAPSYGHSDVVIDNDDGEDVGGDGNVDESEEIVIDNISRREADISLLELKTFAALVSSGLLDASSESPAALRTHRRPRVWRAKRVAHASFRTPWYTR